MSETKRERYHKVLDEEPDRFIQQVIQMHGPYEVNGLFAEHKVDNCIACNVLWPCHTFRVLEERHEKPSTKYHRDANKPKS